jgi:hypothetical protein
LLHLCPGFVLRTILVTTIVAMSGATEAGGRSLLGFLATARLGVAGAEVMTVDVSSLAALTTAFPNEVPTFLFCEPNDSKPTKNTPSEV